MKNNALPGRELLIRSEEYLQALLAILPAKTAACNGFVEKFNRHKRSKVKLIVILR